MWKVLIVDDEQVNCKLLEAILEDLAVCTSVYDGISAVGAFEAAYQTAAPFDALLLDVAMPGMDGLEVLMALRKFEENRGILLGHGIPAVMVTAHPKTFMKSFVSGCDDFVAKPVDAEKLLAILKSRIKPAR